MTIMKCVGWGAILGAASVLGGCGLTRLQAPAVTPETIEATDIQLDQQLFKVRLHVQNPNDRSLPIKSVSCNLQVEGVDVGKGESSEPFTIPALGDQEFEMIVTTHFATSAPNLLARVLARGRAPEYRFSGWVNPDIALIPPIPFAKSGQLEFQ
jgi:LEA14-like dessication related protein